MNDDCRVVKSNTQVDCLVLQHRRTLFANSLRLFHLAPKNDESRFAVWVYCIPLHILVRAHQQTLYKVVASSTGCPRCGHALRINHQPDPSQRSTPKPNPRSGHRRGRQILRKWHTRDGDGTKNVQKYKSDRRDGGREIHNSSLYKTAQ